MIFAAPGSLLAGKRFYADVKARAEAAGRDPEHLKILPAAVCLGPGTNSFHDDVNGRMPRQRPRVPRPQPGAASGRARGR